MLFRNRNFITEINDLTYDITYNCITELLINYLVKAEIIC